MKKTSIWNDVRTKSFLDVNNLMPFYRDLAIKNKFQSIWSTEFDWSLLTKSRVVSIGPISQSTDSYNKNAFRYRIL